MKLQAGPVGHWIIFILIALGQSATFGAEASIHGAGATFPYPVYARWAVDYKKMTGIDVSYEPIGSGAGIAQIEQGLVDFGATDAPLTPTELQRAGLVQFPAVIGGVTPVVNIGGIKPGALKLSGQVLADIYLGKVRRWNDPAIAGLNSELKLPSANITVVHRADASGTTFLWSDFLGQSSPEWRARLGTATALPWPVGVAGVGNEGVASYVQRTRMSIGYVEQAYAKQHRLNVVSVRNRDGVFVLPGRDSFEAAARAAHWNNTADLSQVLTNQAGPASWPITGASFILLRASDPGIKSRAAARFFNWALKHDQQAALDLDYVALPDNTVSLIDELMKASNPPAH